MLGSCVYAFNAPANSWDVLKLPEGTVPTLSQQANRTSHTVRLGSPIYEFNIRRSKWKDIYIDAILNGTTVRKKPTKFSRSELTCRSAR